MTQTTAKVDVTPLKSTIDIDTPDSLKSTTDIDTPDAPISLKSTTDIDIPGPTITTDKVIDTTDKVIDTTDKVIDTIDTIDTIDAIDPTLDVLSGPVVGQKRSYPSQKSLCYDRLTVGDANEKDMIIIKSRGMFEKTVLILNQQHKAYNVEYTTIDKVTYLRSLEKYESFEFEQLFGFGGDCHDFVKGKIIVVRNNFPSTD